MIRLFIADDHELVREGLRRVAERSPDLLEAVRRTRPDPAILILSIHPEETHAITMLRLGASGYLSKDRTVEDLVSAVLAVRRGKTYVSPSLAEWLVDRVKDGQPVGSDLALTPREREVLALLGQAQTTKAIARELGISSKTVATHITRLREKLGVRNTLALTRCAVEHGIR